jgi:DNA-binding FadR family transcriptional regulator
VRRLSHESLDGREIMMTGHAELVAAVEARDPRAAEEAMNRNLQHAEEVMLTVLHRQGER